MQSDDKEYDRMQFLELLSVEQIEPLHAGLFVALGVGTHWERIIDSYEIILADKEVLSMHEEGRVFHLQPGQSLLLWPGKQHGGAVPYAAGTRFYWIHFRLNDIDYIKEPFLKAPQVSTHHERNRMVELFRWYIDDQSFGCLTTSTAQLIIAQMLSEITNASRTSTSDYDKGSSFVRCADEIIHTHYNETLTTAIIADMIGCNPDHLGRLFKQIRGMTITEALHRRKINRAMSILIETSLSVYQIAAECGFSDQAYFRKIFHRYTGMSPLDYRRKYTYCPLNSE